MRYIELFAGIGGFRYGLKKASCNKNWGTESKKKWKHKRSNVYNKSKHQAICVYANEIDKYACQIYRKNFGNKELYEGDIKKVSAESIPDFDMLTGGFPCQSFSIAGKRKGMSGEDTRGSLFYEIYRIAKCRQPKLLLLENVPGLFSSRGGEDFLTILKSLDEIGYDVEWDCVNTSVFLPQNRLRVFIIGHFRGKGGQKVFPIGETMREDNESSKGQTSGCIKSGEGNIQNDNTYILKKIQWDISGKGYNYQQEREYKTDWIMCCLPNANPDNKLNIVIPVLTPGRIKKRQHGRRFKANGEPSFTLTEQDKHGIYNGTKIRRLTPTECERLQGFPDGWTEGISDTQRYKCLGNAVTTNVITEIGIKILEVYNERR